MPLYVMISKLCAPRIGKSMDSKRHGKVVWLMGDACWRGSYLHNFGYGVRGVP